MAELKGFCHPQTPNGTSQLMGPPPYHFGCEQMIITYKTDPEMVKRFLPDPLEPSLLNPGGCCVRINSFVSLSDSHMDMFEINPERCNFKEAFLEVNCRFQGQEAKHLAFIWVDNDFTLVRGWFMGAPKKLGQVYTTFEKHQLHNLNPNIAPFGPGKKLRGIVLSHADKLITGTMTMDKQVAPDQLPKDLLLRTYNNVFFPDISIGYTNPCVKHLVHDLSDVFFGDMWSGKDASLDFFESEIEEHTLLKPQEITGSFFLQLGLTMKGVVVDHDY